MENEFNRTNKVFSIMSKVNERKERDFKNLDFIRIQLNCNNTIYVTNVIEIDAKETRNYVRSLFMY